MSLRAITQLGTNEENQSFDTQQINKGFFASNIGIVLMMFVIAWVFFPRK